MGSCDRDLYNSRLLDVHRVSDHPEVKRLLDDIWDTYFSHKFDVTKTGPKPKGRPKQQYKVLFLDLYVCWTQDPTQCLAVSLTNGAFKVSSRYNDLHISDMIREVIAHSVDCGLIGFYRGNESAGVVSRVWPSQLLIKRFKKAKFTIFDIDRSEKQEVIILNLKDNQLDSDAPKKSRAKPIEYQDTDFADIPEMRYQLQNYNTLLARSFIDIGSLDQPWFERPVWDKKRNKTVKQKVHVTQNNKFVRRIFTRGDWNLGGRFYGGFWQQVGEDLRKHILINDKRTVEIDYSGFHVNLCYAIKGTEPIGDPYTISEDLFCDVDRAQQRNAIKILSLCAINAKDEKSTYQAFRDEQETGSVLKRLKDKELAYALQAFKERHSSISEFICTDKGVELQNLDGKITARIMEAFTMRGVPVLTIHDSYIVPDGEDSELVRQMDDAVDRLLPNTKVPIKPNKIGAGQSIEMWTQAPVTPYERNQGLHLAFNRVNSDVNRCKGYNKRLESWNSWIESNGVSLQQ